MALSADNRVETTFLDTLAEQPFTLQGATCDWTGDYSAKLAYDKDGV